MRGAALSAPSINAIPSSPDRPKLNRAASSSVNKLEKSVLVLS
ncbi:unannotated protein [freshwater metagenome]|uniref:Unannotated protein n=1 Tax=freshwater metagenome TaxID=449393 RepID=A0A6J7PIA4_9ZZZZ